MTLTSFMEDRDQVRRWAMRGGALALLIAVVAGGVLGLKPLRARAAAVRADPLIVRFDWPALNLTDDASLEGQTWMPESEQWQLEQIVQATVSPDPFDADSLEQAQRTMQETGWFERQVRITRKPGGVIQIEGDWRVPSAVVRDGATDRLVATGGELLRLEYPAGSAGGLRVITGAFAGPPPGADGGLEYGAPWVGSDVSAALALIGYLRKSDAWESVVGVDVSTHRRNGKLGVLIAEGGRVVWGGAPGSLHPGEQSDAVKLRRLERLVHDPTWINAGRPPIELYTPYMYIDESAAGG